MPHDPRQTCAQCAHFDGEPSVYGHCRRYAPRPVIGDASTLSMTIFPYLHATQWCGEWELKEDACDSPEWD